MTKKTQINTIGKTFKKKRQQLNLDIESISKDLNISNDVLRNLEEENWHLINKNLYLTGLILSYGKTLMIDPEIIDKQLLNLDIQSNTANKEHQLFNIGENLDLTPDKKLFHASIFASAFFIIFYLIFLNLDIGERNTINYPKLYNELTSHENQ